MSQALLGVRVWNYDITPREIRIVRRADPEDVVMLMFLVAAAQEAESHDGIRPSVHNWYPSASSPLLFKTKSDCIVLSHHTTAVVLDWETRP